MPLSSPQILALDFDGVICDGLIEYFQTTCRVYQQIWFESPSQELAPLFFRLRPVIETGWEMPVLLRALILGVDEEEIFANWPEIVQDLVAKEELQGKEVAALVDRVRDEWISDNLSEWLSLHRFYPGVIEKLRQILTSDTQLFIITTKEGRFAQQLLQREGINLAEELIFGKEVKRPKYETLRLLMKEFKVPAAEVCFVEDRLKTLQLVAQQKDLQEVKLFLADWGYNTQEDRRVVEADDRLQLLSLADFIGS